METKYLFVAQYVDGGFCEFFGTRKDAVELLAMDTTVDRIRIYDNDDVVVDELDRSNP